MSAIWTYPISKGWLYVIWNDWCLHLRRLPILGWTTSTANLVSPTRSVWKFNFVDCYLAQFLMLTRETINQVHLSIFGSLGIFTSNAPAYWVEVLLRKADSYLIVLSSPFNVHDRQQIWCIVGYDKGFLAFNFRSWIWYSKLICY